MIAEHIPPQSIDAEQSLLGALLLANESWDRVSTIVSANDFYREEHGRIYTQISKLVQAGKPADVLTVAEAFAGDDIGLVYLSELARNCVSVVNAKRHAEMIADRAKLRAFQSICHGLLEESYGAGVRSREVLDRAVGRLIEMADGARASDEPRPLQESVNVALAQIQERYENPGKRSGIETGFTDLDEITGGLQRGDLIIIGGRPSMGKTAFAINIAENVAMSGAGPVLVFSIEMSDDALATRSMASVGNVAMTDMRTGRLTDDDWARLSNGLARLHGADMFIDASSSITVAQMHAKARRLQRKHGQLSLVVIDYMQLISSDRRTDNKNNDVSEISRALKLMAKDLKVPLICLSQLNRGVEQRGDKRPGMADLRDSGAIEQDADLIGFMYRDDYYNPGGEMKGFAELGIRKHRMGAIGDIPLVFKPEISRFQSADRHAFANAQAMQQQHSGSSQSRGFRGE